MSLGISQHHIEKAVSRVLYIHREHLHAECIHPIVPCMSLFSFALLFASYFNLHASSTPISSDAQSPRMGLDSLDVGSGSSRHFISPPTNLPLRQCSNFNFDNSTLSALCDVQPDDAGPPLGNITTTVDLNKCIANVEGGIVFQAE
jgi:hypothetical protein